MRFLIVLWLAVIVFVGGCSNKQKVPTDTSAQKPSLASHERLHSALWMQTSVEYRLICEAAYRQARHALDSALADENWTAALEQVGDYQKLQPAVVLDLDETVIDNSPFQGYLVKNQRGYSNKIWQKWSKKAAAKAIAGAVDFIAYARAKGVETIFVTNRLGIEQYSTLHNLRQLGIKANPSTLLCKGEKGHPDWTSDKTSRRKFLANKYRILLLVGDDLNDFVASRKMTLAQRNRLYELHRNRIGRHWILLPNPIYGSWEASVMGGKFVNSVQEALKLKLEAIHSFE